ncbi:MAG: FMN-binding glutamate synthase family protein, partial [Candidatus Sericytochromatia bacterium]|nr:FMN-binding glutamate synthase family protein [Candidatus Sericytochromatia bacterium]
AWRWPDVLWAFLVVGPIILVGIRDLTQKDRTLLRIYPVLGHGRFLMEGIRPEIQQYFVESNTDGSPFSREERSLVYQRAKGVRDTLPFGTLRDVYRSGYEWMCHSLAPLDAPHEEPRIRVGGPDCLLPYAASVFNVSAMSFGSLSKNAILALNHGAKQGGFAHNTGEGGLSPYHLKPGGDLIWQIGTGYFGCRDGDGHFSAEAFARRAATPAVKMIEIKLSQGAKPGHGGILPAKKLTHEIAAIRGVPMGRDVVSPPAHSTFATPEGLLHFVAKLRDLSGGKPIGFKLCVGERYQFLAICKAMLTTGIAPDFITVDGAEGGTGAAPVEFSNSVGTPLADGLVFVHNALTGFGLRHRIRIIASGRLASGFDIFRSLALGADMCNSARGMMLALGCIQARACDTNECPVGVATQDPVRSAALDVPLKADRADRYHRETVKSFLHLLGAAGMRSSGEIRPRHVKRRISDHESRHFGEIYAFLEPDVLRDEATVPLAYREAWHMADPSHF